MRGGGDWQQCVLVNPAALNGSQTEGLEAENAMRGAQKCKSLSVTISAARKRRRGGRTLRAVQ